MGDGEFVSCYVNSDAISRGGVFLLRERERMLLVVKCSWLLIQVLGKDLGRSEGKSVLCSLLYWLVSFC